MHALGQVASVRTRTRARRRRCSAPSIRFCRSTCAWSPSRTPRPDFHARFGAIVQDLRVPNRATRRFVSPFDQRYVWHVPGRLDVEAMRRGAQVLLGRHDFAAFQSVGGEVQTSERTILDITSSRAHPDSARASRRGLWRFVSTGDGFLRHMVRTIAGTLADVGLGRWQPEQVPRFSRPAIDLAPAARRPPRDCFSSK